MGTIRKLWRKMRKWFDRKGKMLVEEAKEIIKDAFVKMSVPITDLFDEEKREAIADELRKRLRELRQDLTEWIIDTALDSLWDEVRDGFRERRTK